MEAAFSAVFFNFEKYRPEVADDVISGVTVDKVGMNVSVKFGDSVLNSGQIIRLFASRIRFTHFCAVMYLIVFCSRLEAASDGISGRFVGPTVPDNSKIS